MKKQKDFYQPDLFDWAKQQQQRDEQPPMLCCGHVVPYMHHCPFCGTRND